jgi:hypothetical protein
MLSERAPSASARNSRVIRRLRSPPASLPAGFAPGSPLRDLAAQTFSSDMEDIGLVLNDAISRLEITPQVVAWNGRELAGVHQAFGTGVFSAARGDLDVVGNDAIRSILIPTGFRVRACEDEGHGTGGGVCREFTNSVLTLPQSLDHRISWLSVQTGTRPPISLLDIAVGTCRESTLDPGLGMVTDGSGVTVTRWLDSVNGASVNESMAPGMHVFEPGISVVRYDVIDSDGNMSSVTQTVTVGPVPSPWSAYTTYAIGQRVTFGGQVYECRQAHNAQPNWQPASTPALWQIPNPCGRIAWHIGTDYEVGATVDFAGHTFRCISAHHALPGWEPGATTASLWEEIS